MVKRFNKGKLYTLCLANNTNGDINTWCANVQYKTRIHNVLEFHSVNCIYTVDLDDKIVAIQEREVIEVFNYDTGLFEYDELDKELMTATLTNIVQGWLW